VKLRVVRERPPAARSARLALRETFKPLMFGDGLSGVLWGVN